MDIPLIEQVKIQAQVLVPLVKALQAELGDTLERLCCSFLAFGLDWSERDGVLLKLTGGPDVKAFVGAHLIQKA